MADHQKSSGSEAPTPPGFPLIGALPLMKKDPLKFLLGAVQEYGDVVCLGGLPSQKYYFLNDPHDIERVFKTRHREYVRGANFQLMRDLAGNGLFLNEGESWSRQRKLIQPTFHMQRLAGMFGTMLETTSELVERWTAVARKREPLEIEKEVTALALDLAVKTLFGCEVREQSLAVREAVTVALAYIYERVWSPANLPSWLPTPANRRFQKAIATIDEVVYGLIAERRASGELGGDVLSMLLTVSDEETGEAMPDRQIRDEVVNLMVAGHETTAVAICWTLFLVSQHPDVERRVHEELDTALGGNLPTLADIPRLSYLGRVLKESLRLYPPFWMFTRSPIEDDEIGGHPIPAGSILMVSPYVTHRHLDYWENPEAFDPERFSPERSAGRPLFAYYPFGHGPRQCIGQRMADLECLLVLSMVLQRVRLNQVPGRRVEPHPSLSLRSKGGFFMTLHERQAFVA